jgi:hypothetical protein
MTTRIVERLKTGSVKNVVPFGIATMPAAPYVVVKPESVVGERSFLIIAHFKAGQNILLEDYIFNEVSELLKNFVTTDRHGNNVRIKDADKYTDIVVENDDSTISMERIFYVPSRLH